MKAAQISEYGDPSVIKINEADKPTANEDQVIVEVHASSVNPYDNRLRAGYMKDHLSLQFPFTLGGDIAGVIAELGSNVSGFAVGDKVYGQAAGVAGNSGALAEYAATKASQIGKMPANLGFNEAGSLPLVGVSALQAIKDHINLQSGQKIFIHGGAGGIGTIAIQIAKHLGGYVATTATGDRIELVKKLGADEVIDYKTQDFAEVLRDFDAVFDTVGGGDFVKSYTILHPGGIAVSMAAPVDAAKAQEHGITALTQGTKVTTEALNALAEFVEKGVITPMVHTAFTFDQVQQAFAAYEAGKVRGKVVITIP